MTNEEFIGAIIELYRNARLLSIDKGEYNIWRGVNHSVSSQAEDLFALFIAKKLNDSRLEFIVDKTFSLFKEGQKSIQFRPDLAIVLDNKITHIFDLKMDLGYKRNLNQLDSFKAAGDRFRIFREKSFDSIKCKLSNNNHREFLILENIKNQIVVVSKANGGDKLQQSKMINEISNLDWTNIYYLSSGVHPNNPDINKLEPDDSEFNRLLSDIRSNLS